MKLGRDGEMADTLALGASIRKDVQVQVLFSAGIILLKALV